jgi:outer membrane protein, multidrug efflux system
MFNRARLGAASALCMLLVACSGNTPDYQKPDIELPNSWGVTTGRTPLPAGARWWTLYKDERLDKLVDEALANNANLAVAVARVEEARGQLGVVQADLYPTVGAGFDRSRLQTSQRTGVPMPPGTPRERNDYRAALNVSYEIDLWGRIANSVAAARAELLATEAARDTVRIALTADVVNVYFLLRALDEQVAALRRSLQSRRDTLGLQRGRLGAGVISELEVRQLEAEIASTEAQLPQLERQRGVAESALAVLAGRAPRLVYQTRFEYDTTPTPAPPQSVPAGLPSDLLLRRPDIVQAEQQLIAANARVASARVAWFPTISLTGFLGSESAALTNLFTGPAGIFNFAASVAQPIFSGGRQEANINAVRAREEQAAQRYRLAIQNAFREVRDALVAQAYARIQVEAEEKRALALRETWRIARLRLEHGVGTQLEVLDAERGLLASEVTRSEALRAQRAALADLVKALGGGWE